MRILVVAPTLTRLRELEHSLVMTPAVQCIAREITSEHDTRSLAGLAFDAILGLEHLEPVLAGRLAPLLRQEPYHV